MGMSLTYKILSNNLIKGELKAGNEIAVRVHQTLTQDSTGTMAYLQLNSMNVEDVATEVSVAYVDHNMLQSSFENADDHEFIKTSAEKHNIVFSKPGNGICHRLHLERFGKPGKILIGSDSHTPTGGGLGMLAIGAGGLDVAIGMARGLYYLKVPKVYNIELRGKLKPWVSAKDIILYVLKELTVKGGVGFVMEYTGEGIKSLSVEDRATITNMGAELGATTSIFPSDELTRDFLIKQSREEDYIEMLQTPVPEQDLSITTNPKFLKKVEKQYVVDILRSGSSVIQQRVNAEGEALQSEESYVMMRKFGLILLRDIMEGRDSLVRREFSDLLSVADENDIRAKFSDSPTLPDDDINTSVDQTKRLIKAIRDGLEYPPCINGSFRYTDVIEFLNKLATIFEWDIYEKSSLGKESLRRWYAVILCQWMEGTGLSFIMKKAIEYRRDHPENFRVSAYQPPTTYNDRSKEHRNVIFAETLKSLRILSCSVFLTTSCDSLTNTRRFIM